MDRAQSGWAVVGIVESPILGPEGNREFLLLPQRRGSGELGAARRAGGSLR